MLFKYVLETLILRLRHIPNGVDVMCVITHRIRKLNGLEQVFDFRCGFNITKIIERLGNTIRSFVAVHSNEALIILFIIFA